MLKKKKEKSEKIRCKLFQQKKWNLSIFLFLLQCSHFVQLVFFFLPFSLMGHSSKFGFPLLYYFCHTLHFTCHLPGWQAHFESQGPYINRGKLTVIYICILKYYNDINNYNNITCIHSIIIIICCLFFNVYSFYFF